MNVEAFAGGVFRRFPGTALRRRRVEPDAPPIVLSGSAVTTKLFGGFRG